MVRYRDNWKPHFKNAGELLAWLEKGNIHILSCKKGTAGNQLLLHRLPPHSSSLQDTFVADKSYRAEIELLESEIRRIGRENEEAKQAMANQLGELGAKKRAYANTSDVAERQRLHDEIAALESGLSSMKAPGLVEMKIEELRDRIAKIRRENGLKNEARRQEIKLRNQQELARVQETRWTGVVTWVELSGIDIFTAK